MWPMSDNVGCNPWAETQPVWRTEYLHLATHRQTTEEQYASSGRGIKNSASVQQEASRTMMYFLCVLNLIDPQYIWPKVNKSNIQSF